MPENVKHPGNVRRRIRVLLIISSLVVGGTERQLVYLAKGLDPARFRVVVCCLSSEGPYREPLVAAGIPVVTIGFAGFGDLRRHPMRVLGPLWRLVRLMRSFRPDVVHGFLFWAYIIGAIAARVAGVPVVVTGRRVMEDAKVTDSRYLFLDTIANRFTDLIVANSEAVRRDTLAKERLPNDKVAVIYNGIEVDCYYRQPDEVLRRSLALPDHAPVVGILATLDARKGHHVFLDAWKGVVSRHPEAVVLLIGDGPMRPELEARVGGEGLSHSVRFLGTRHDIPEILAALDFVVQPSFTEGFSNAIMEAMAAGKPVIATDVAGNPEAITHMETGLLVAPADSQALADAMLWLVDHPQDAVRFGKAAREKVALRFDLRWMVQAHEHLYERLLLDKGNDQPRSILRRASRPSGQTATRDEVVEL